MPQHNIYTRRDAGGPPPGWTPGRTDSRLVQAATSAPRTYDAKAHTVEIVIATGYRVRRWFGWEELLITPEAVDLKRVNMGHCRLLDSHNQGTSKAVLGNVISARVERGELVGKVRFVDTPAGREAERQMAAGEVTSISAGYKVNRLVRVGEGDDGDDVYRAEAWELLEASLVSVPADPYAGARSLAAPFHMRPGSRLTPADAARLRMTMATALLTTTPRSPAQAALMRMQAAHNRLMRPRT